LLKNKLQAPRHLGIQELYSSTVRKERKKGKRVAIKGKFVFNTQEILGLVKEAEAEVLKRNMKKRQTTTATTPEIEDEEEEGIEESISESENDCIIVASSRLISK
jgi:hypothetical protein